MEEHEKLVYLLVGALWEEAKNPHTQESALDEMCKCSEAIISFFEGSKEFTRIGSKKQIRVGKKEERELLESAFNAGVNCEALGDEAPDFSEWFNSLVKQ